LAPLWIDEHDALALHDRLLALDGGAEGVRDAGLLASALARARQIRAYGEGADIIDMAVAHLSGIVRNHPFVDGNKRTGFLVGVLFLELNGYRFTATEEDATQAVLSLAAGKMDEAAFAAWMRRNVERKK
jgi:death-on-curing protein